MLETDALPDLLHLVSRAGIGLRLPRLSGRPYGPGGARGPNDGV